MVMADAKKRRWFPASVKSLRHHSILLVLFFAEPFSAGEAIHPAGNSLLNPRLSTPPLY